MKNKLKLFLYFQVGLLFLLGFPTNSVAKVEPYVNNWDYIDFNFFGSGESPLTGKMSLQITRKGTSLTATTGADSKTVYHNRFVGYDYFGVDLMKANGENYFHYSGKGEDSIKGFANAFGNQTIAYGDVIHVFLAEDNRETVYDANNNVRYPSKPGKDAYYQITEAGFFLISDGIQFKRFDEYINIGMPEFYISIFGVNNSSMSLVAKSGSSIGAMHSRWPGEIYYSLDIYNTTDHVLKDATFSSKANGDSVADYLIYFATPPKIEYGNIFRNYHAEPTKNKIYHNGVMTYSKQAKPITYYEFTKDKGLVPLDFNLVAGVPHTLELGSSTTALVPGDFVNASKYTNVYATKFLKPVDTNKLGDYDIPIEIRQDQYTAPNYFLSEVNSKVKIVDTTPPKAEAIPQKVGLGDFFDKKIDELVKNIQDNSGSENVTGEITKKPDTSIVGKTSAIVTLTDPSANKTDITIPVTVVENDLLFEKAPELLGFDGIKLDIKPSLAKRKNDGSWTLLVKDSRLKQSNWDVAVNIEHQLKTVDGHILENALVYVDENGGKVPLNEDVLPVFKHTSQQEEEHVSVEWADDKGILLEVPPTAYVNKEYTTTLNWDLRTVPTE